MSRHALEVLEFERVLERIAQRASSEGGRRRVLALEPRTDPADVERELTRVGAVMRFVEEGPNWALGPVPDVAEALAQLPVDGAVLEPIALHRIGVLLRTSRLLSAELDAREQGYAELESIAVRLLSRREWEELLERSVGEEGEVLSSASADLKRIRDRLRGAHAKIVRQLEAYLKTLPERYVVPDSSVSIRDGRYVVPVRREGRGEVGGIVHDESQTGATLYVEPPVAIELMNRLRDLEREEAREIRRILGVLTSRLAPEHHALGGALEALGDFDALHARARTALAWDAAVPEVVASGPPVLRIRGGRHPLLLDAASEEVVPFDLELAAGERCMVVSGPNTGGKSVFLKAVGLITALAQSGVVPPVGPETRLPVFGSFFADIGDEQSIARSLSTFSAHLSNLSDIVTGADDRSLVLIDEMGTGTDPAEGAALARSAREELVERGATTLVSSHLGELKRLDGEGSGIVQFDAERMEPTYRLVKGRPGRSYGLAIARRLGFPGAVLDRAERYRGEGEATMEDVLERLEAQERTAERLVAELDVARARAQDRSRAVEARATELEQAERTAADRAREDARKLLMDARSEVEAAIRDLRASVESGESVDEAATEARRRVERAAGRQRPPKRRGRARSVAEEAPSAVEEGAHVKVRASGARGRVLEMRSDRALVEVGGLKLELPVGDLSVAEAPPEPERPRGGWTGPAREGPVRTEVDLRGMRVDEMELELERALDQAVYEDLSELRIIHGKGTGALRQRVGEILDEDRRVRAHRMGGPTEGGAGVTVATLGAS